MNEKRLKLIKKALKTEKGVALLTNRMIYWEPEHEERFEEYLDELDKNDEEVSDN